MRLEAHLKGAFGIFKLKLVRGRKTDVRAPAGIAVLQVVHQCRYLHARPLQLHIYRSVLSVDHPTGEMALACDVLRGPAKTDTLNRTRIVQAPANGSRPQRRVRAAFA